MHSRRRQGRADRRKAIALRLPGLPCRLRKIVLVTDLKAFRRVCYMAARRTGGEVVEFRISNEPTPNFHQAVIAYRDRTVAVACVRSTPILAVALPRVIEFTPARECSPLTFVDVPDLAAALADASDFRLLSTAELDGPADTMTWPWINERDMRYWQPHSLGEALFNYRD